MCFHTQIIEVVCYINQNVLTIRMVNILYTYTLGTKVPIIMSAKRLSNHLLRQPRTDPGWRLLGKP